MSVVFFLLFIAAVAGVFRPYINGAKRWHFGAAAVVAFMLVGAFAPNPVTDGKKLAAAPENGQEASAGSGSDAASAEAKSATKWEYSESKDEMRGTTAKTASLTSDNTVDLQFPYGEVHGELWIRRRPEDGLNVAFQVEKGQVLCHSFTESYISMKFDDGPIQKFRCTGSSDGSTETAFIEDEGRALAALKRSKRAVVEAEFFQQGRQQFVFETAGLRWK